MRTETLEAAAPFDRLATAYSRDWSGSPAGAAQRRAVHRRLARIASELGGGLAVDLGCGIGDDARFLAAIGTEVVGLDSSGAMLAEARLRGHDDGSRGSVRFVESTIETATAGSMGIAPGSVDLVLSNFSPLNCVTDLAPPFALAAELLRPGGRFVAVLFGTFPLTEIALALASFDLGRALRRRRFATTANVGGTEIPLRYWCSSHVKRAAGGRFRLRSRLGIGLLVPPSGSAAPRRLVPVLEAADRLLAPALPSFADHVLYDLERIGG